MRGWRILAVLAAVFVISLPEICRAECRETESGRVSCDTATVQRLRDKARVAQLFCEQLPSQVIATELSPELAAMCADASRTSTIYADAQTKRKHAKAADEAQRQANRCRGRLESVQSQRDGCQDRIGALERTVGRQESTIATWKAIAGGACGLVVLSNVAWALFTAASRSRR